MVTAGKHINNIRAIARQPSITTIEELLRAVFSFGSVQKLYDQDPRPAQGIEIVHLRNIRRTVAKSGWKVEEYPLLEVVARELLLKTLRAGEDLVFAAVICEVWRSARALY
jgi:hypothetical protein